MTNPDQETPRSLSIKADLNLNISKIASSPDKCLDESFFFLPENIRIYC
jgi:hypothetical protein